MPWGDKEKYKVNIIIKNPVTYGFVIYPIGEPKAVLEGVRVHDNITGVWYEVYPEEVIAYCTAGKAALHIVFGAVNGGNMDGNLWGKLVDDEEVVIIPKASQWTPVGNLVWWEKTIDMPQREYSLTMEMGH